MTPVGASVQDWQGQSLEGLRRLRLDRLPAAEILFLDALAAHLMGARAPRPPYTIEHGTLVLEHLLRALAASGRVEPDAAGGASEAMDLARAAVLDGAHRFGARGGPGIHQLVTRFLTAAVGELEIHRESPEAQVRSLFYFGLLAVASGPENRMSRAAAGGVLEIFGWWNAQIGAGYVPPWRILDPDLGVAGDRGAAGGDRVRPPADPDAERA